MCMYACTWICDVLYLNICVYLSACLCFVCGWEREVVGKLIQEVTLERLGKE